MEQLAQITYKEILPSIQQGMIPFPELIRFGLQKKIGLLTKRVEIFTKNKFRP